eukprot:4164449-Pyramimonas_sp.AAC.1
MQTDSFARKLIHSRTLVLRLTRVQSLVLRHVIFVRVVYPATNFGAPPERFVAQEGAPPKTISTIATLKTA